MDSTFEYQLLDTRVHGGCATIVKAEHKSTATQVAMKFPHTSTSQHRLDREARILTTLSHPGIVDLLDRGVFEKQSFIATRWIDGVPLSALIDSYQDDPDTNEISSGIDLMRAIAIVDQIADALHHAHQSGIYHGDLSPGNVIVTADDKAILIDFGTSRAEVFETETDDGNLAGTPRYLAPEVIRGELPTEASDQYALALIFHELLTGQWAFTHPQLGQMKQGCSSNAASVLHHQLYSSPEPLSEVQPGVNTALDKVLFKALHKTASHRYDSIVMFVDALKQASHQPVRRRQSRHHKRQLLGLGFGVSIASMIVVGAWMSGGKMGNTAYADAQSINVQQGDSDSDVNQEIVAGVESSDKDCNLFNNASFEKVLSDNFYRDANRERLASVVEVDSIAHSPVLKVGDTNVYGQYGVILPIDASLQYDFSVMLEIDQYIHRAEITIDWLDSDWQLIEGATVTLPVKYHHKGVRGIRNALPPAAAHYAVPTVFKDASVGILYADDFVFSPSKTGC